MAEIWKSGYSLTAIPTVNEFFNKEVISTAEVAGLSDGRMAMVYTVSGTSGSPDASYSELHFQLIDPFGQVLGSPVQFANGASLYLSPVGGTAVGEVSIAASQNGTIAVAFTKTTNVSGGSEGEVFLQLFNSSGAPVGSNVNLNINSTQPQQGSQEGVKLASFADGSFVAVWSELADSQGRGGDGSGSGIFLQRFSQSGALLGGLVRVNSDTAGNQRDASVSVLANGEAWVTWTDALNVYGQRFSASGAMLGSNQSLWAQATAPGAYLDAYAAKSVALDGGGFALVWTSTSSAPPSTGFHVLTQAFDAAGQAAGTPELVQASAVGYVINAYEISAAPGGGYSVLIKGDDWVGNVEHLTTVRYASNGAEEARADLVNSASHDILGPAVASFDDGRELVLYTDAKQEGSVRAMVLDGRDTALLTGSTRDDVIVGHATGSAYQHEVFTAGLGSDAVYGLSGNDYLYMGEGDDVAVGGDGVDVLLLEAGNDYGYGGTGDDHVFGGQGNDTLVGEEGVDVLQGEQGDDIFDGGAGGDFIYGGAGNDFAYGRDGNDIFVMAEGHDIAFGELGQDYFYLGDGDDQAHGGDGVDVFLGGAGNDSFEGGTGVDYAWGEAGNDLFVVRQSSGVLVVQDFKAGGVDDALRLISDTGITTFAQALAASTYYAGMNTTIITIDADTAVWLVGVNKTQLTTQDFIF